MSRLKIERSKKRKYKEDNGEKKFQAQLYNLYNNASISSHPQELKKNICDDMTIQEHMWMQIAFMHAVDGERRFFNKNIDQKSEIIWKHAPFICPDVIKKVENKDEYKSFNLHLSVERIKNHMTNCPNCPYNSLNMFSNCTTCLKIYKPTKITGKSAAKDKKKQHLAPISIADSNNEMKYKYIRVAELFISLRELGGGPEAYIKVGKTVSSHTSNSSNGDENKLELSTYKDVCFDQKINVLGSINPSKTSLKGKVTTCLSPETTNTDGETTTMNTFTGIHFPSCVAITKSNNNNNEVEVDDDTSVEKIISKLKNEPTTAQFIQKLGIICANNSVPNISWGTEGGNHINWFTITLETTVKRNPTSTNEAGNTLVEKMNKSIPSVLGDQPGYFSNTQRRTPTWYFVKTKDWINLKKRLSNYDFKKSILESTDHTITFKFQHCFFVKNKEYLWKYIRYRNIVQCDSEKLKFAHDMTCLVATKKTEGKWGKLWEELEAEEKFVPIEFKRDIITLDGTYTTDKDDDVMTISFPSFPDQHKFLKNGNLVYASCLRLFAKIAGVSHWDDGVKISLNTGSTKKHRVATSSGNGSSQNVTSSKFTIEKVCKKCAYCNKLNALCYNNDTHKLSAKQAIIISKQKMRLGDVPDDSNTWHSALLESDCWELFRLDDKYQIFILMYHLKCNDLHECYGLNEIYVPLAVQEGQHIVPQIGRFDSLKYNINKQRRNEEKGRGKIKHAELKAVLEIVNLTKPRAGKKTFPKGFWVAISAVYNAKYGTTLTSIDFRDFYAIDNRKNSNRSADRSAVV